MFLNESFSQNYEIGHDLASSESKTNNNAAASKLKVISTSEKPSLSDLRSMIASASAHKVKDFFSFNKIPKGFPKGSLIALSGQGKTQLMAEFLGENADLKVAWIESTWTLNASSLARYGIQFQNVLCVEAQNDSFWATLQILQSGLFDCVLCQQKNIFSEKQLRQLQLACESTGSSCFFLLQQKTSHWSLGYEIEVYRFKDQLDLDLRKSRCG